MKNISKIKTVKKLVLAGILVLLLATICGVLFISRNSVATAYAHEQEYNSKLAENINNEFRDYFRGGYSIDDIRQMLGQQSLYQHKRVHTPYDGVITYEIPIENSELENMLQSFNSIAPMNSFNYVTQRIYGWGRDFNDSIIIVLMGDGFTQAQQTAFINHANSARNFMMGLHPFSLFRDLFIIYAVQTISPQTWVRTPNNTINRFRTYEPSNNRISMPPWGRTEARAVANWAVRYVNNPHMIQVIANTTRFGGIAYNTPPMINLGVGIAVTTVHTNGGGWHRTFVHEFGHTFGGLGDERNIADDSGWESPNMTTNRDNPRWSHWIGHAGIGQPVAITRRWYVPYGYSQNWLGFITGGCIMAGSSSSIHNFCAVCSAELTRRMAYLAGETFQSRHPNPGHTVAPNNANVVISPVANRVVAYAFNGNTIVQQINLSNAQHIGRFAFLGATSLRRIIVNSVIPPVIDPTAFAGLTASNITAFVPIGTGNTFRNAPEWSRFTIIEKYTTSILADGSVRLDRVNYPIGDSFVVPFRITHALNSTQNSAQVLQRPITIIGNDAFNGNTALKNIAFAPNSQVQTIGHSAFMGSGITSIIIPSSVTWVDDNAFRDTKELRTVNFAPNSRVIWLGHNSFRGSGLLNITIPASVNNIGDSAFRDTSFLGTVTFENNSRLASIWDNAFKNSTMLQTFILGQNSRNVYIGRNVFEGTFNLIQVDLTGAITIDSYAFANSGIGHLIIPLSVSHIAHSAFTGWTASQNIRVIGRASAPSGWAHNWSGNATVTFVYNGFEIRNSVLVGFIPPSDFNGHAIIPHGVTAIGDFVFANLTSLTNITLPNSLTSIGYMAFYRTSLKSFYIPSNLTHIGAGAFNSTIQLERITVTANHSVFSSHDGVLYGRTITEFYHIPNALRGNITIPYGIINIPANAFANKPFLQGITLPSTLRYIGFGAFQNSGLTQITLPQSVLEIHSAAFLGNSNLQTVIVERVANPSEWQGGITRLIGTEHFALTHTDLLIYVPTWACVAAYSSMPNWSTLAEANRITTTAPIIPTPPAPIIYNFRVGLTFGQIPLPGNWEWVNPNAAANAGTQSNVAIIYRTPPNFNDVPGVVNVTIQAIDWQYAYSGFVICPYFWTNVGNGEPIKLVFYCCCDYSDKFIVQPGVHEELLIDLSHCCGFFTVGVQFSGFQLILWQVHRAASYNLSLLQEQQRSGIGFRVYIKSK